VAAEQRYRHTGFVLVRASTAPGGLELPDDLDLADDDAVAHTGRAWLTRIWQRDLVKAAMLTASPDLCSRIDIVLADENADVRQLRRLIISTCSYLLRWRYRSTPFGLFAGVSGATVGDRPTIRFGDGHQPGVRADADWLGRIIGDLERNHDLLWRVPVVVNDAGFRRGDRYVLPMPPADAELNRGASLEASVRLTRPLRTVLARAVTPTAFSELADHLSTAFPTASSETVCGLLTELVRQRILITGLRPPMTAVDGLGYLVDRLVVLC
jgi:hypothetical protein